MPNTLIINCNSKESIRKKKKQGKLKEERYQGSFVSKGERI